MVATSSGNGSTVAQNPVLRHVGEREGPDERWRAATSGLLRCAADGVSTFVTHVSFVTDALSSFYYRLARPRGKPQMRQDIAFNVANA